MQRRQWQPTPVLLLGKSHQRRSLVGCSPWGGWGSDKTEQLHFHFSLSCIGEGNGNSPQCSCLENPRDGGAWWAAVYGVTQSWTRLKWLSSSSSRISQKVFRKEKLSSSRIHYCYIILTTEFKLSCLLCNHLKEKKKKFYVTKTKECREKKRHLSFSPLEDSRPLSPPREPQTPFSSSGTPDLSTCLGIDFLTALMSHQVW